MKHSYVRGALAVIALGLMPVMVHAPVVAGTSQTTSKSSAQAGPVAFFTGTTISKGTIKEALSAKKTTRAVSNGSLRADGALMIKQTVEIGDDPVRNRTWLLRESSNGKITGTISDATSPVTGTIRGNAMTLSYKLEGGLKVNQVLTIAADGRTCSNEMKIRKFGFVVARLSETITRQ
ncbi:MAG: DUF3833 family protein [Erythrobacter sp.]